MPTRYMQNLNWTGTSTSDCWITCSNSNDTTTGTTGWIVYEYTYDSHLWPPTVKWHGSKKHEAPDGMLEASFDGRYIDVMADDYLKGIKERMEEQE